MDVTTVRVVELAETTFWQGQGFGVLLGAVLGAALGLGAAWFLEWRQAKKEQADRGHRLAALTMLFLDEFTDAFGRCVMYYEHYSYGMRHSYSSIYQPTSETALTEFIGLCDDMALHESVFRVKAILYQVASTLPKLADAVHRSSGLPAHLSARELVDIVEDQMEVERARLSFLADQYLGAVVAFFLGENKEVYPVLVDNINTILEAAAQMGEVDKQRLARLADHFKNSQDCKKKVDEMVADMVAAQRDARPEKQKT